MDRLVSLNLYLLMFLMTTLSWVYLFTAEYMMAV